MRQLILCLSSIVLLVQASLFQRPFFNKPSKAQHRKLYNDQIVLRISTDGADNTTSLYKAIEEYNIDVWSTTNDHIDIRLHRDISQKFLNAIPTALRKSSVRMIPDLEYAVHRSIPRDFSTNFLNAKIPSINDTFFSDFQTVEAIEAWMSLVVAMYPDTASLINLGKTHEGRSISGIHISRPASFFEKFTARKRNMIIVHGAQHAREWISISTVCYLAYSIIAGQDTDSGLAQLVQDFDWVFIPTVNVDGYAYTFQDRLWRKNRQPTIVPFCKGIDLDRNWNFGWSEAQTTVSNPCSENYQGAVAFEAQETKALSEYIKSIHSGTTHNLVGYLDLHSYAQTILYPYSLSCDIDVKNEESLLELGLGASRAMKAASGEHYETESACNQDGHILANLNSGAALDWIHHGGVPWSYVVKLRDTGSYGFLVPREEIVPTGEEMLGFLRYYGTFISEHGR